MEPRAPERRSCRSLDAASPWLSLSRRLFLAGLLLSGTTLLAQAARTPEVQDQARLSIKSYRSDSSGLPTDGVEAVLFDHQGYLWAATQQGAARYNGWRWEVLNLPRPQISNWVNTLLEGADGSLWLGSNGDGLHRRRAGAWTSYPGPGTPFPRCVVLSLLEAPGPDGRATLWVGTLDAGLWRIDADGQAHKEPGFPLEKGGILALHRDAAEPGGLWAGTSSGAYRFQGGRWQACNQRQLNQPWDAVRCIHESRDAAGRPQLWFGTQSGLTCLQDGRWSRLAAKDGLPFQTVIRMAEGVDSQGVPEFWLATDAGLVNWKAGRFTSFRTQSGIPTLLSDLQLRPGPGKVPVLWLATYEGLLKIQPTGWHSLTPVLASQARTDIRAILQSTEPDGSPSTWLGTLGQGLLKFNRGAWTALGKLGDQTVRSVYSLLETRSAAGRCLWVGSRDQGLFRLQNGQWRRFHLGAGLPDDRIFFLKETRDARGQAWLWAGTRAGLARFDGRDWRVFTTQDGLGSDTVTCLLETRSATGTQVLWAGTRNGGIARLDGERWTSVASAQGLPETASVTSMLEREGAFWITTNGGGVWVGRPEQSAWAHYHTGSLPALPSDSVYGIQQDAFHQVYLFTDKGVARLTPRVASPDDQAPFAVYVFTEADGLPDRDTNQGSVIKDARGRIWVGTPNGAAILDPTPAAREPERPDPAALVLESAQRLARGGELRAGMALAHWDDRLRFQWALLDFVKEDGVRFRTRLEGLEAQPGPWDSQTQVGYERLPAGSYRFQVWARNARGAELGPVSLPFRVLRPPWFTAWAWAGYLLLGGAGIGGLMRRRTSALERRNRELRVLVHAATAELHGSEQRAQEANRAKSAFLAGMSHELRTPLNAILGYTQLMARDPARSDKDRLHLDTILRAGEHLLGLINGVLSVSRIEADQLVLNSRPFNTAEFLLGVEELIRVRAASKALSLDLEVDPALPPALVGDETKLRQVLLNLLGNAVKFTEQGGLLLRVAWLAEQRARFEVLDSGPGIPPESLGQLFSSFYQTELGSRTGEGTGLGLYLSQAMVRLMGGQIQVSSQLGVGTCFSFELPLSPAAFQAPMTSHSLSRLLPGQTIPRQLVVDDQADNRELMVELLEEMGFPVKAAGDGSEALRLWQDWRPAVIWMDIRMAGMDGYEATRRIRAEEQRDGLERTTIIALTASVFEHDRTAILACGCDEMLAKPFRERDLLAMLSRYTGLRFEDLPQDGPAPPEPGREELAQLPGDWLQAFQLTLLAGDTDASLALLERLPPDSGALAQQLRQRLLEFRLDELIRMFKPSGGDHGPA